MAINMIRLANAGFEPAGKWLLSQRRLELALHEAIAHERNVLYAFAVDGALAYVGKTTLSLRNRMQRYKTPPTNGKSGGSTNIKNNRNIVAALTNGHTVDIFILRAQLQQRHGEFLVNLAAGLEDNLIAELAPPWNGRPQTTAIAGKVRDRISRQTIRIDELASLQGAHPQELTFAERRPIQQAVIKHTHQTGNEPRLSKFDFQNALRRAFADAGDASEAYVDIRAGTLHTRVGGYPAKGHSMPTCCSAMRDEMKIGDQMLAAPPKGKGANLIIRYRLRRG
jgi:hypothetical protein